MSDNKKYYEFQIKRDGIVYGFDKDTKEWEPIAKDTRPATVWKWFKFGLGIFVACLLLLSTCAKGNKAQCTSQGKQWDSYLGECING